MTDFKKLTEDIFQYCVEPYPPDVRKRFIESALIKADAEAYKRGVSVGEEKSYNDGFNLGYSKGRESAFKDSALIVSAQIGLGKTLEDAYRIIMGQIKA